MIDWNWPVEFHDGTPAWFNGGDDDKPTAERAGVIHCADKPFGVPVARAGRLYSLLVEFNEPRLRNVELPEIRFEKWNATPVAGTFVTSAVVNLKLNAGDRGWDYSWPSLKPLNGAPTIITLNRKQAAAAAEEAAAQAELESSDFYGMF